MNVRAKLFSAASNIRAHDAGRNPALTLDDKESTMIKPLEEYSPEERAFVEFVQRMRSQPPKAPHDPGPFNYEEVRDLLGRPEDEIEDLGIPFGVRYKHDDC
jgi:hypothetical protein